MTVILMGIQLMDGTLDRTVPPITARACEHATTGAAQQRIQSTRAPTLWDKQRETIVNNESAEIIRMLSKACDDVGVVRDA
ncbi:MAG: hypothetical protein IT509_08250 [Rhodocyclaceae bacterium]|nr:hypothetical protein [Rhodocyclaceae bacterium]